MSKPKEYINFMGKILDFQDFIIFRPKFGYRINSNSILIKVSESDALVLDAPPLKAVNPLLILKYLEHHKRERTYIKAIILSHAHQDHFAGLKAYQNTFPKAYTITHNNDINGIRYPFLIPESWKAGLRAIGRSKFNVAFYSSLYTLFSHIYFNALQITNRIDISLPYETSSALKIGNISIEKSITIIPTPGHTMGHISLLDANKNLYVADLVPFTPWICPIPGSLEKMMASISRIINLGENKVERIVKSHGDIRNTSHLQWEVVPYSSERENYKFFLDSIYNVLDEIPHKIRGKHVSISDICRIFNPNYDKYSKIMKTLFIPPAVSWGIAYTQELERRGEIKRVGKGRTLRFTA